MSHFQSMVSSAMSILYVYKSGRGIEISDIELRADRDT